MRRNDGPAVRHIQQVTPLDPRDEGIFARALRVRVSDGRGLVLLRLMIGRTETTIELDRLEQVEEIAHRLLVACAELRKAADAAAVR